MKPTLNTKNSVNILSVLKVAFTIVGTLIGAGFASGKEITTFFGCFGTFGYIAILIFCITFAIGIIYFSSIDKDSIPTPLLVAFNIAVFVSEVISITAMIAGLSSILSMLFISDIPFYLSLVLIFMIIICGINGLTTTNLILIPVLFVSIIVFGIRGASSVNSFEMAIVNSSSIYKIMSLPLYIGFNLFSIFPIALEFGKKQNKKERTTSAILASTILLILMLCFCVTILNIDSTSITSELPLVMYILKTSPSLIVMVITTLAIAITTTIISDGFVLRGLMMKRGENFANIAFGFLFIGAFCLSHFGFSAIVETLYPISGFIGLILIILVAIFNFKQKAK